MKYAIPITVTLFVDAADHAAAQAQAVTALQGALSAAATLKNFAPAVEYEELSDEAAWNPETP